MYSISDAVGGSSKPAERYLNPLLGQSVEVYRHQACLQSRETGPYGVGLSTLESPWSPRWTQSRSRIGSPIRLRAGGVCRLRIEGVVGAQCTERQVPSCPRPRVLHVLGVVVWRTNIVEETHSSSWHNRRQLVVDWRVRPAVCRGSSVLAVVSVLDRSQR